MSEEGAGGGMPGSQVEGACVDTGNHTEAKMSPAQVSSRLAKLSIIDSAQQRTYTLIHAYWLPLNLFLMSRQPQLR